MKSSRIYINSLLSHVGYRINKISDPWQLPHDVDKEFLEIFKTCREFTKTSMERMYGLYKATEYVVKGNIPGDIVECGVWRGGSIMVSALALKKLPATAKKIYLYDTYKGMVEPGEKDVTIKRGDPAHKRWEQGKREGYNAWVYAPLDEVKKNVFSTGYPPDKFVFVEGMVEDTVPQHIPEQISLLRLDTDFYSSTKHELIHLFPRLSRGGVLIIDDYGCFQGAKDAVDEYIQENNIPILLHRVDGAGRVGIKI